MVRSFTYTAQGASEIPEAYLWELVSESGWALNFLSESLLPTLFGFVLSAVVPSGREVLSSDLHVFCMVCKRILDTCTS